MINILYNFLVIYFPDVMPTLAALTGGTQYLPQKIKCELHQKTGQYLKMQKAGKSNWLCIIWDGINIFAKVGRRQTACFRESGRY